MHYTHRILGLVSDSPEKTEVELEQGQREGLEQGSKWVNDSAAELGFAYLEYAAARTRFEILEKNLANRITTVREAETQQANFLKAVAAALELGPGEWVYDGVGYLVKKGAKNAKSS